MLRSAENMLSYALSQPISGYSSQWALRCTASCLYEFEIVAASIPRADIADGIELFRPFFQNYSAISCHYKLGSLLDCVGRYGYPDGVYQFCAFKKKQVVNLVEHKPNAKIYGFPATRISSKLLDCLRANGFSCMGLFDNDSGKHGVILDGYPIFNPINLSMGCFDDSAFFIVVNTASRRTGLEIAAQLESYGLREHTHFTCACYGES
ncbi:MAG: hypothetical protein ACP5SH_00300 [Syntrophobacteraceae bacterium]